ncbi:MAG: LPS export ABC transporter periplasmic protein LptC [candidate division Zixibacteria bacterium]|nr:LPS export ABC transporter periplasmic protein LptC [candidate division Zixibacteria bacterium]
MNYRRRIFTILVVVLGLLGGCSDRSTSQGDKGVDDSLNLPDSEVHGATIHLYTGKRLSMEIKAASISQFESADSTMAYELDVDSYDPAGDVSYHLTGDSGIIREQAGDLEVFSHVVVVTADSTVLTADYMRSLPDSNVVRMYRDVVVTTADSTVLKTDSLVWDANDDMVRTDAFVNIAQPTRSLSGWGLEAPKDLSSFRILRGASSGRLNIEDKKKK